MKGLLVFVLIALTGYSYAQSYPPVQVNAYVMAKVKKSFQEIISTKKKKKMK